jgi:hypothetical protein
VFRDICRSMKTTSGLSNSSSNLWRHRARALVVSISLALLSANFITSNFFTTKTFSNAVTHFFTNSKISAMGVCSRGKELIIFLISENSAILFSLIERKHTPRFLIPQSNPAISIFRVGDQTVCCLVETMESLKRNLHNSRNILGLAQIIGEGPDLDLDEIESKIVDVSDLKHAPEPEQEKPDVLKEFDLGFEKLGAGEVEPKKKSKDIFDELDEIDLGMDSFGENVGGGGDVLDDVVVAPPAKQSYQFQDPYLQRITQEEKARAFVGDVLRDTRTAGLAEIESEENNSELAEIIGRIEGLKKLLQEQDADVQIANGIDMRTDKTTAKNVLMVLQKKYDNQRFSSLFEDSVLAGAHVLEGYFNGKDTYFDFTGLSLAVGSKMRKMSYTTSNFVGEAMKANDIGPGLRIALELALTVVLHSRERKIRKNDTVISDPRFLREVEEVDTRRLNDV